MGYRHGCDIGEDHQKKRNKKMPRDSFQILQPEGKHYAHERDGAAGDAYGKIDDVYPVLQP